ncbi:Phage tail fibre repeat [Phocoenobacter uteri]|uniref:Phage tail fibre repeat n=1 Tax=Phocoenobacter uteri TaxID=146806 RepID=A0A379CAC0_9PAST|nr:phage tail protein [Phocoenobacter uteri]MDG6881058.1 hypothetical protein [Phocoenobacter uteri]SUB59078.1 Phage tail fibre repeat [Phocoenobacter uteri]
MSKTYFSILTRKGAEMLAQTLGEQQLLTHLKMAVGDGNGQATIPSFEQTQLVNSRYSANITKCYQDPKDDKQVVFELQIPENIGGFYVRELGLLDKNNHLLAIANTPESYKPTTSEGSGKVSVFRLILKFGHLENVTLNVDSSTVYLTTLDKSDRVDLDSSDTVATSTAVKTVYDKANEKVSKNGDTMTGILKIKATNSDWSSVVLYNQAGKSLIFEATRDNNTQIGSIIYRAVGDYNGHNYINEAYIKIPKKSGTLALTSDVDRKVDKAELYSGFARDLNAINIEGFTSFDFSHRSADKAGLPESINYDGIGFQVNSEKQMSQFLSIAHGRHYLRTKDSDHDSWHVEKIITDELFKVQELERENLDNITTYGIYGQGANAEATAERNYPQRSAGTLLVTPSAYGVRQEYKTYHSGHIYFRNRSSTGWYPWKQIVGNLTTSVISEREDVAATLKAVKIAYDKAGAVENIANNKIDNSKKSNSVSSTSADTIATSRAVKIAYDKGEKAEQDAKVALNKAIEAKNTADKKASKTGDTFTGYMEINYSDYSGIGYKNTDGYVLKSQIEPNASRYFGSLIYRKGQTILHRLWLPKKTGVLALESDVDTKVDKTSLYSGFAGDLNAINIEGFTGFNFSTNKTQNTGLPEGYDGDGFQLKSNGQTTQFLSLGNGYNYFRTKDAQDEDWKLDKLVTEKDFKVKELKHENLDEITDVGLYGQPWTKNATVERHYPVEEAGSLVVTPSAYGVRQEYKTYHSGHIYFRNRSSTGWYPWKKQNRTDYLLIGVPIPYPLMQVPENCLAFNGQAFNKAAYPELAEKYPSGRLPDLRGLVIRGLDNGRGYDADRTLLSEQGDAIRNITGEFYFSEMIFGKANGVFNASHTYAPRTYRSSGSGGDYTIAFDASTVVPTASENRMKNIAFQYICLAR